MCGQLGLIYGEKDRRPEDRSHLKWLFMYLLLLSEKRGPYATGVSWLKQDGSHRILKRPARAVDFVKEKQFVEMLSEVDDTTTWLAGHTRWPTKGSHLNNKNNHPILVGKRLLGTHNGVILNADALFRRFDLPRLAEVDSEIIFRMADDTLRDGCIDVPAFKERLALCQGQISAVLASKLDPKTVVVIKGNKPLELRYHEEHQVIIYASDPVFLNVALDNVPGWRKIDAPPMSILTFNRSDLLNFESTTFALAGMRGKGSFERYVGPEED